MVQHDKRPQSRQSGYSSGFGSDNGRAPPPSSSSSANGYPNRPNDEEEEEEGEEEGEEGEEEEGDGDGAVEVIQATVADKGTNILADPRC